MEMAWNSSWSNSYNIICETLWSSVKAWACMASSGTGLLVFSDNMTEAAGWILKCIGIYCLPRFSQKLDWAVLQSTTGWWPKSYSKSNPAAFEGKKNGFVMAKSLADFNPIQHTFHSLKTKLNEERPTNKQLNSAAVKAWQSLIIIPSLWWCPRVPGLRQTVPEDSQQNIKIEHFMIIIIWPITFEPLKMGRLCIKMVVISKHLLEYLCSTPWIKA